MIEKQKNEKLQIEPLRIEPALLTIPQVCAYLNICRSELYRLKESGKFALLPVPLCRKLLYSKNELLVWIRAGCPHRKQWQNQRKEFLK